MFDCGVLLYIPSVTIAVYSTGRRASEMLKEQVEQFIEMTGPENTARIVVSNQEKLFISHDLHGETISDGSSTKRRGRKSKFEARKDPLTAKLHSYPTSKKGKGNSKSNTTTTAIGRSSTPLPTAIRSSLLSPAA